MTADENDTATTASGAPAVNYQSLKSFIAEEEALEAANQKPAPLTKAQRKALEQLTLSTPPAIGDTDWVSLLFRYRQAHPDTAGLSWVEEQSSGASLFPGRTVGRMCLCKISESLTTDPPIAFFPGAGYGIGADGVIPTFPRKKEAKQFAAKCAIEWLISQRLIPDNLKDVVFPKVKPQPPPPVPKKAKGTTGVVDFKNEALPATQRVATLCHRLGFRAPSYILTQDPESNAIFSGRPDFGNDNSIPSTVGVVKDVYTKKYCKEKIAEEVLAYLLAKEDERRLQRELLLGLE